MQVGEYELINEGKYQRAHDVAGEDEASLLAEYDKLGGLILKDNEKIEMGSFWDFKAKRAIKDPQPKFSEKLLRAPIITEEVTGEEGDKGEGKVKVIKPKKERKVK